MTKVCHLTSVHKSNDVRIFLKECRSLANSGFDVSLVCVNEKEEIIDGVKIISVNDKGGGRIRRATVVCNKIYWKAVEVNADIYHFHDPELLRIGFKLKRKGKKVIYDAHEDLPRQIIGKPWIPKPIRSVTAFITEWLENFYASRMSVVLTATPFIAERFKKINPNTIDVNNFPLKEEMDFVSANSQKENAVCYIGGITEIRGIYPLLEAINISKTKLFLAGDGSDELKKNLAKKSGWSYVEYAGFVSREEARKIMSKAAAGVVTFLPLPNHVNAQPNKMFEYMAAGLPLIGSHFPFWKDIIEKNNCGILVNPESPEEIANAIEFIIANPDDAKRMGENGRKAVFEKYNWEPESRKLINLYKTLS